MCPLTALLDPTARHSISSAVDSLVQRAGALAGDLGGATLDVALARRLGRGFSTIDRIAG